jgi:hypothetical protein
VLLPTRNSSNWRRSNSTSKSHIRQATTNAKQPLADTEFPIQRQGLPRCQPNTASFTRHAKQATHHHPPQGTPQGPNNCKLMTCLNHTVGRKYAKQRIFNVAATAHGYEDTPTHPDTRIIRQCNTSNSSAECNKRQAWHLLYLNLLTMH